MNQDTRSEPRRLLLGLRLSERFGGCWRARLWRTRHGGQACTATPWAAVQGRTEPGRSATTRC